MNKGREFAVIKSWIVPSLGLALLVALLSFSVLSQGTLPINLTDIAGKAVWLNDRGENLPFPGSETDARGFARIISARVAGIPKTVDNVLETHPRWVPNGTIEGRFHLRIPADAEFATTVGFIEGATGTDGVTFEVCWKRSAAAELVLMRRYTRYGEPIPATLRVDLSAIAGQEGDLILRVRAGATSDQDWAVWVNPRIQSKKPDLDHDSIPDEKEAELLAKFRPYLLYTKGEDYRPCDAVWYIRHSSLKPVADEDSGDVISRGDLERDPAKLLTANKPGSDWGPSDLTRNPKRTRYCLNPGNQYRDGYERGDGYDWIDIVRLRNVGIYGHVVPWRGYYQISYWLFYGYSETEGPLDIGDHEGDWESVHLLIDPNTEQPVKTFHCLHGKEIIFDLTVKGVNTHRFYVPPIGVDYQEFRGPNYDTSNFDIRQNLQRACNNLVRFARDPKTGEYTHIMVYVERNTHGSWPSEHWRYTVRAAGRDWSAPPHNGDWHHFLSSPPPNLGEVEFPLSSDARVILQYNGRWGAYRGHFADAAGTDTPPGPALHWQWVWPDGSALRKRIPDSAFTDGSSFFRQ